MTDFLSAIFLGFIEGLTEFIPVSSTGHLIIVADLIGFVSPGRVFEVFIQLGAILAVVVVFREKLFLTAARLPYDKKAQLLAINIIIACIPALLVGALTHSLIKSLYVAPIIAGALIVGGVIILLLEKRLKTPVVESVDDIPVKTALLIGCFQMLALIPGVSRSGATIMGALALGLSRRAAAEFSFFVAIPIMTAAVAFDTYKHWDAIASANEWPLMIAGFISAFLTAMLVLKFMINFINRWGFEPFGCYRIGAGIAIFAALAF